MKSQPVAREYWKQRRAKTIVVVGTNSGGGEITVAQEVYKEFQNRNVNAAIIATSQQGLWLTENGVELNTIGVSDIAGTVEKEIEQADRAGFAFIIVEGQWALSDQRHSGKALGLLHGVMPEAILLCHQPGFILNRNEHGTDGLDSLIRLHEEVIELFHPTKVVGIGMQSDGLTDEQSVAEEKRLEMRTGLPVIDVRRFGAEKLVDALLEHFRQREIGHSIDF